MSKLRVAQSGRAGVLGTSGRVFESPHADQLDDDGKLRHRFSNKKTNARKEGIRFSLTFDEFCVLLLDAGITSSMLGIKGYHIARYGDAGAYEVGNCRALWYTDNYHERRVSEKASNASRANFVAYNATRTTEDRKQIFQSEGWLRYVDRRRQQAAERRK